MARIAQRLAIIGAIAASIIGYLYYTPNSEGIAQMNRVRVLTATMKVAHLIGTGAELFGLSDRVLVIRKISKFVGQLKDKQEDADLQIENTLIENIPVRIARPLNNNDNLPAIVFFHGGAFYMGSVDTHNALTSALARSANVVVISVEYRLAPEHPFPAGLDDCYTVAKYVLQHGNSKKLRIDQNRVALAGDSAGGNIAAVSAMRFATNPVGKHSPRLQILIYPVLQLFDMMLPSYIQPHFQFFPYTIDHTLSLYFNEKIDKSIYANNHTSVQQKKRYRKYVDWSLIPSKYRTVYKKSITDDNEGDPNLIKRAKEALNPEASPLLVEDNQLAKLPPTYILSVGHDRLRDEAFIYEGRLKHAGVPVVHNHYENTFHGSAGFLYGPLAMDIAHEMLNDMVWYRVIQNVVNRNDVQSYAAKIAFEALQAPACHENMVQVAGYILGEYGNLIALDPRSAPMNQFDLILYLISSTNMKFINLFSKNKHDIQDKIWQFNFDLRVKIKG